jgi:UDP-3-O-[3-hydroxymyristoyl] glucosamine N-acyltransferase
MRGKKLSVLKNASDGCITYYVGDNIEHVKHLKNCILICNRDFNPELENVEIIHTEDPQLEFYKLSHSFPKEYTFTKNIWGNNQYFKGINCDISEHSVIGDGVIIGDNVTVGPGTVIYSKTIIGNNVRIDSNCTIGTEGMMWVWDNDKKVFLKQLGGVIIRDNCIIGSGTVIVRGSANENTILENNVNMAPGCLIGHGCHIGNSTHFANGVKLGGSVVISDYNFLGSGSIISPGVKITCQDVVIGAGSTVVKNIDEEGVYIGTPTKKIKSTKGKLKGIPIWRKK